MKTAVILVNLGTPANSSPQAVRRFLRQFLSDPRVVELPRALWLPILYGVILPFRPRRVAQAYETLWQHYGDSPLRSISERQRAALSQQLSDTNGDVLVEYAFSYGAPSIAATADKLLAAGVERMVLLPLYPQYSATTTATVYDQVGQWARRQRRLPALSLIRDYHRTDGYIAALAESVHDHWEAHGRGEKLLLSFHGIPQRNVDLGDPYYDQCLRTATLLADRLELAAEQWQISFQSRLGRAQWLQPYTAEVLKEWGAAKLPSVDVICPAFAADCLETLEEIDEENRGIFTAAGGGAFHYIPCLNDRDSHIAMLAELVKPYLTAKA